MPSCFGRLRLVALGARGWGFAWPGAGALGHPAFAQCQARQAPEQEAADPDGVVHGERLSSMVVGLGGLPIAMASPQAAFS